MSSLSISGADLLWNTTQTSAASSIGSLSGLSTGAQDTSAAPAFAGASGSTTQAVSVDISKPGELFQKLNKLKQQDPAKYKQVVADLADKLKKAADSSTGDDQKELTRLAATLQKAADGGDLPSGSGKPGDPAVPPSADLNAATKNAVALYTQGQTGTGKAHHGHHHHAPSAAVQQTLQSASDEIDAALSGTASPSATALAA